MNSGDNGQGGEVGTLTVGNDRKIATRCDQENGMMEEWNIEDGPLHQSSSPPEGCLNG